MTRCIYTRIVCHFGIPDPSNSQMGHSRYAIVPSQTPLFLVRPSLMLELALPTPSHRPRLSTPHQLTLWLLAAPT